MASRRRGGGPSQYHHGDLRAALIQAGAELLARRGGGGALSLRAVARRAGVSHAAPYHHFPGKEDLLGAIAAAGFEKLDAAMEAALRPLDEREPMARFAALGPAYVRFAVAEPSFFRLMFQAQPGGLSYVRALGEVAQRPFARVRAAVQACLATWPSPPSAVDATQVTMLAWASMHGLATLWTEGALSATKPEELERRAADLAALVTRLVEPPPG